MFVFTVSILNTIMNYNYKENKGRYKNVQEEALPSQVVYCEELVKILCVYNQCFKPLLYLWLSRGVQLILHFGGCQQLNGHRLQICNRGADFSNCIENTGHGLTVKNRLISITFVVHLTTCINRTQQ